MRPTRYSDGQNIDISMYVHPRIYRTCYTKMHRRVASLHFLLLPITWNDVATVLKQPMQRI
jgi:hypothetical protein